MMSPYGKKVYFLDTTVDEDAVVVIKREGSSDEQLYYRSDIRLNGDFIISMDVKADLGKFISYILNDKPSYGGTTIGWRDISDWTKLRITRINNQVKIYYGDSKIPNATYPNDLNDLYFIIRFNGMDDENKFFYRNLTIFENGTLVFHESGIKNDENFIFNELKLLENKLRSLELEMEYSNKILDSYNSLFNTLFLDFELKPKGLLSNIQNFEMELLNFVNNVCRKHDLKWWLSAGNLLGAYRHEGFIPWDDDMDIEMLRKDYNKFLEIINLELENNNLNDFIRVRNHFTVDNTLIPYTKLDFWADNNLLGFIDIFPFDFICNIDDNLENIFRTEYHKYRKNILDHGIEPAFDEVSKNLNLSLDKQDFMIYGIEGKLEYFSIHDTNDFFPLSTIKFEDSTYPCPNNVKSYLQSVYGENFLEIPKIIYSHGLANRLRDVKNINTIYEKYISMLKSINENFK